MKQVYAIAFQILIAFVLPVRAQEYFEIERTFNCNCGTFTADTNNLKAYSGVELDNIFKSVMKSGLESRYPQGGCQQRAEMIHNMLDAMKIEHVRIWLFSPRNLVEGESTLLELKDPNMLSDGGVIKWGYHVSVALKCAVPKQEAEMVVIDPAMKATAPMAMKDWFAGIGNATKSKYTFLQPDYYFFYTQNNGASNVLNGYFYKYEPLANITTMYDNAVVEREIAVSDVAMWLKAKLDNGYKDDGTIRNFISKVENLIGFYAGQQRDNRGSLKGATMRALLRRHGALINESLCYYQTRVDHWMQKSTDAKQ